MAEENKSSFPMLPAKSWWMLREKFKKTIPSVVTENYLATSLAVELNSARDNVLRPLKQIGLISDEGKPQDIVKQWRDDHNYAKVCQEIRQAVYPQELLDTFPGPDESQEAVERWIKNHSGVGDSAAKKQAAFYLLLTQADASKSGETTKNSTISAAAKALPRQASPRPVNKNTTSKQQSRGQATPPLVHLDASTFPTLHIDIQIHIAPDTSAEQIDRIFESMARHFKGLKGNVSE